MSREPNADGAGTMGLMYGSLGDFIEALEQAGELRRVKASVSPLLEISEIADRESKSRAPVAPSASAIRNDPAGHDRGGRAILFEHVQGSRMPVLINAFGSYSRMEMALGCSAASGGADGGGFEALAKRIEELTSLQPPSSLREALRFLGKLGSLARIKPKMVRIAPCQQVAMTGDEVDLTTLPLLRCWPLDGDLEAVGCSPNINGSVKGADLAGDPHSRGRYVTFAGVHTIHADDAGKTNPRSHNIGMYRMQLVGKRTLAMHWHMHHDGARHWRSWKRIGKPMPVAIAFGAESVLPFASIAPLPPGVSELLLAGFLNGHGIRMCWCETVPIRAPAQSEIVIEGFVSTEAGAPGYDTGSGDEIGDGAFLEGPFGDHTGFYSLPDRYPLMNVTAITMRKRPVFPATIVGMPPQEDYYLGKAVERLFLPLLRTLIPDVHDYDLPAFGAFHNCAVLSVDKSYPLQARRLMHAVWGAGQMAWTKMVIVVDADVDVHDPFAVLRAVGEHCHPATDHELVRGPLDILDHAAPWLGAGSKIGFDATRRSPGEGRAEMVQGEQPEADILELVKRVQGVAGAVRPKELGGRWIVLQVSAEASGDGRAALRRCLDVLESSRLSRPFRLIAVGAGVDVSNLSEALFHWCANMDPGRDMLCSDDGAIACFDSTPKSPGQSESGAPVRAWPPLMTMDQATRDLVDRRWSDYGLD